MHRAVEHVGVELEAGLLHAQAGDVPRQDGLQRLQAEQRLPCGTREPAGAGDSDTLLQTGNVSNALRPAQRAL